MKQRILTAAAAAFVVSVNWPLHAIASESNTENLWNGSNIGCRDNKCYFNDKTAPLRRYFSVAPIYRTNGTVPLYPTEVDCQELENMESVPLPAGAYFREVDNERRDDDDHLLVQIYQIPKGTTGEPQQIGDTYFARNMRLCIDDNDRGRNINYERVGGMNAGVLVVPYKLRSGDLYSDASIGPYLGYEFRNIHLVVTAGLANISTSKIESEDVESKLGLTYGAGAMFQLKRNWQVGLVVGRDRLSGDEGDSWRYQDKTWWAIAIGFDFLQ